MGVVDSIVLCPLFLLYCLAYVPLCCATFSLVSVPSIDPSLYPVIYIFPPIFMKRVCFPLCLVSFFIVFLLPNMCSAPYLYQLLHFFRFLSISGLLMVYSFPFSVPASFLQNIYVTSILFSHFFLVIYCVADSFEISPKICTFFCVNK